VTFFRKDFHRSTQKIFRNQAAENQVGVRDRGQAAPPITGRARIGSRAPGADPKGAAPVRAGDRSAAGAHRVNIDHGQAYGKIPDHALPGPADPVIDEGDIR